MNGAVRVAFARLQFERDQPLGIGGIDQSARHVGMIGATRLIERDRGFEVAERTLVLAGTTHKSSTRRFDIAQRKHMACGPQNFFRFVQQLKSVLALAALERQPAFVNLCHCDQPRRVRMLSGLTGREDVGRRTFVFALLAMRAAPPEVHEKVKVVVQQAFACHTQHKVEHLNGVLGMLCRQRLVRLDDAQLQVIEQSQLRLVGGRDLCGETLKQGSVAVTEVRPLRNTKQQRGRIECRLRSTLRLGKCLIEQAEALANVAVKKGSLKTFDQRISRDLRVLHVRFLLLPRGRQTAPRLYLVRVEDRR